MNFYEYQQEAAKTFPGSGDLDNDIHYLALGLAGEVGELANLYKKIYHSQNIREKYLEEAGACLWYLATLLDKIPKPLQIGYHWRLPGSPCLDKYFVPRRTFMESDFITVSAYVISSQYNIIDNIMFALGGFMNNKIIGDSLRTISIITMELLYSLCHPHGITLDEIYQFNIAKLRDRHGESYNPEFYQTKKEVNDE